LPLLARGRLSHLVALRVLQGDAALPKHQLATPLGVGEEARPEVGLLLGDVTVAGGGLGEVSLGGAVRKVRLAALGGPGCLSEEGLLEARLGALGVAEARGHLLALIVGRVNEVEGQLGVDRLVLGGLLVEEWELELALQPVGDVADLLG